MKGGPRQDVQLLLIVAGAALAGVLAVEGACHVLLATLGPREPREAFTMALASPESVRRQLSPEASPRLRHLATVLNDWGVSGYLAKPPRPHDPTLRAEGPVIRHRGLRHGRPLFDTYFRLSPNLDDEYELLGADTHRLKHRTHYVTDAHGRRATFASSRKGAKFNLLFMGCSMTVGDGVGNQQAFPARVGALLPSANAHNFGVHGHSPAHTLRNLMVYGDSYLDGVDPALPTLVVYTMIEGHMSRVVGTSRHLHRTGTDGPYLHRGRHGLELSTTFSEASPWHRFYRFFGSTAFARFSGIELPFIGAEHWDLTADILAEIQRRLNTALPRLKGFYVASYPMGGRHFRELIPRLRQRGVGVLDYTDVLMPGLLGSHADLGNDLHPSAEAHDLYAHLLVGDLRPLVTGMP